MITVERTDFISVPVTDLERSIEFYEGTLGLPRVAGNESWPEFQLGENVSLYLTDPTNIGREFTGPHTASIALRVADVAEARAALEAKGVDVRGRDVRHRRLSHGALPRPGRQLAHAPPEVRARVRAELLERYRALPLPTTRDEHWRFTDLAGFDPDAWTREAAAAESVPSMLDLDVAGIGHDRRGGHRDRARTRRDPLRAAHRRQRAARLARQADDKLRAHNAAVWEHGLLVHVPAGVELEKPLYLRVANGVPGGSLFWRVARRRRARSRASRWSRS